MSDQSFIVWSAEEDDPNRAQLNAARSRILSPEGASAQLVLVDVLGDAATPKALLVSGPENVLRSFLEGFKPVVNIGINNNADLF